MADPLIINPKLTNAGQQAALAASNQGVSLNLTHISFGMAKYDPAGDEVALKTPVSAKVTLAGGTRPSPRQLRMLSAWRENIGGEKPITEIGFWSNNILVFIWSTAAGKSAFTKTDGVTAVHFVDLALSSVPTVNIAISVDPAESVALAALAAHEGASNAHPDYVKHSLFPDAQADLFAEVVSGSANAIQLTMPDEVVLDAYRKGQVFRFVAAYTNTTTVTVNINGLGAKPVVKAGGNALTPSDIKVDSVYDMVYDGTRFQLNGGVGGGQFYIEYPNTAAAAKQTNYVGTYSPGSVMVFVGTVTGGQKLPQSSFTATDGQNVTLTAAAAANIAVGTLVTIVALSTFAVADTYTKGEYMAMVATQAQARDLASTIVDRWMPPQRVHEAVIARMQASFYDATAGRFLVPGSFGMGAASVAVAANINTLAASGLYTWGTTTTGRPIDGEAGEVLHMAGDTSAYATQLITSQLSGRAWIRRKTNNTWTQVELFHDGNQLSIGTTPALARTALELGTAAQATLTTSETDATLGRVLRVGDFGIGRKDLTDYTGDLNDLVATGFYFAAGAAVNMPPGVMAGMVIVMTNANNNTQQVFLPQGATRFLQRSSSAGAWSAWSESWSTINLVKTANNADSTIGRMLQVGDFGLGTRNLLTNNLINNVDDPTLGNGIYAVSNTTTGTKPAQYGILLQEGRQNVAGTQGRVSQTFIDVDQAAAPRIYHRVYLSTTSSWGPWVEDWNTGNLVKTVGANDTTVGSMLKVGDFGLGVNQTAGANLIPDNTDLNNMVVSGLYGQGANTKATLALNYPTTKAGSLLVQRGSTTIVTQLYLEYDTGRVWTRAIWNGAASVWAMSWDSQNLEKTTSALDTTIGRMMKVGDFGIGSASAVKWTFTKDSDWSKPGGWSGFIDVAASKANGVTFPSNPSFVSSFNTWTILGQRDVSGGYTGILMDYVSGMAWFGVAASSASAPLFIEIYSRANTSTFIESLLDDANQAEAQATLGISSMINGITTKTLAGSNVTLTAAETNVGVLWFNGTLTANVTVFVPAVVGKWTVYNKTTGNFTLTIKSSGANSVGQVIQQGYQSEIVCGGLNIYFGQTGFDASSFAGEVAITGPNCVRMMDPAGKYGAILRNDGAGLYLLVTNLNDPTGNFNSFRPWTVNLSTGVVDFSQGANVVAPAARDASLRVPSSGWVIGEINYNSRRYNGVGIGMSGNVSLLASQAGQWANSTAAGSTTTLPSSSTVADGLPFLIRNLSGGAINVTHSGGAIQQERGVNTGTVSLAANEWAEFTSSGTSYWITARGKVEEVLSVAQFQAAGIGEITYFAMNTPPAGKLKANGAAVSRTTYAALFAKIGTTFGAGDGSTTFNLPDLRGYFPRGWDDGRGIDSGRVFGSTQAYQNASHTHTGTAVAAGAHNHTTQFPREKLLVNNTDDGGNAVLGDALQDGYQSMTSDTAAAHTHTLSIAASGGNETRPYNIALLACIQY